MQLASLLVKKEGEVLDQPCKEGYAGIIHSPWTKDMQQGGNCILKRRLKTILHNFLLQF